MRQQLDHRRQSVSFRHQSSTDSSRKSSFDSVSMEEMADGSPETTSPDVSKKPRSPPMTSKLWRSLLLGRDSRTWSKYWPLRYNNNNDQQDSPAPSILGLDESSSFLSSSFDSSETVQRSPEEKGLAVLKRRLSLPPVDVDTYMSKREMTPLQEQWNAYTMVPPLMAVFYHVLAGFWIPQPLVQSLRLEISPNATEWPAAWMGDPSDCWSTCSFWPAAQPPYTVLAMLAGVLLHFPWSFLYHYRYATVLKSAAARTKHWSRRMDHAMIHIAAALFCYATSARLDYSLATTLFNLDSAYKQFQDKICPRRNKFRITLAILAYSLPMLKLPPDHEHLFFQFWLFMGAGMWLFAAYPLGGWSHAAFHLTLVGSLWSLLQAAAWHGDAQFAAQCVAWTGSS